MRRATDEGAAEETSSGGFRGPRGGTQGVVVLCGDGVEDGVAAVDEELQGGS